MTVSPHSPCRAKKAVAVAHKKKAAAVKKTVHKETVKKKPAGKVLHQRTKAHKKMRTRAHHIDKKHC